MKWALLPIVLVLGWLVVHELRRMLQMARRDHLTRGRTMCSGRWKGDGRTQMVAHGKMLVGWHVYVQRDEKGRVRYVGRTDDLHERFMAHGKTYRSATWKRWEAYSCAHEHDAAALEHALWKAHQSPWLDNKIAPGQPRRRR